MPVRSKRIGRVPWPLCLEPTKFIANPQSSQNSFHASTLGFYEKNFCWVDVSFVSHTAAEFAVPLIRIFFVQKSLDFSTSPKSLNIESGRAISLVFL